MTKIENELISLFCAQERQEEMLITICEQASMTMKRLQFRKNIQEQAV